MASVIGPVANCGKRRLKNRNFGAGNGLAIFIDDREDDGSVCGGRLGTHQAKGEKEKQDKDEAFHSEAAANEEES
ncbi:MAG: hypothetical protein ABSF16_08415 [Terracidiphilus sp.]